MTVFRSEFTADDLYSGSVLGTVAHAVWTARHPELAHEQRWDGSNYCVQNTAGAFGTVTFDAGGTVAAFFDVRSSQAEAFEPGRSRHLAGAPASLVALAEREALCYLLQRRDGASVPVLSAAFWAEGEPIVAAAPWDDVIANGGHLVSLQLMGAAAGLPRWAERYALDGRQAALVREVTAARLAAPRDEVVPLSAAQTAALAAAPAPGLGEALEILAGIRVVPAEKG